MPGLHAADGDDGVVHGRECDGEGGGLLEIHVRGGAEQPAVVGKRVLRERCATRAHDAVADLDALRIRSELGNFAGPFHAEHGPGAAGGAMGVTPAHAGVGAVETTGAHANQHLRALRLWLSDVGNPSAVRIIDIGLHV
ncbi:hypothetical protein ACVWYH_000316 [Bradyrhizobium sp. GM24.11]